MSAHIVRIMHRGQVLATYRIAIEVDHRRELIWLAMENARDDGLLARINLTELHFMVEAEPTQ